MGIGRYKADMMAYLQNLGNDRRVSPLRLSPAVLTALCGYDPTQEMLPARQAFAPVQARVHCSFAKHARLWASTEWVATNDVDANVKLNLQAFTLFAVVQRGVDGFLFDMCGPELGDMLNDHLENVRKLLFSLSEHDPSGWCCMAKTYVGQPGWVFSFAGEEFFVTTFAGCYGPDNARHTYGVKGHSFVLFQPFHSFLTHNVGDDTPRRHTRFENPTSVRDVIRCRFRDHNQEYFIPENPASFAMALMVVPPLRLGEPFQEFWRKPSDELT